MMVSCAHRNTHYEVVGCTPMHTQHSWLLVINVRGFSRVSICMVEHATNCQQNVREIKILCCTSCKLCNDGAQHVGLPEHNEGTNVIIKM